ncbi:MAG: polysaccharide biosynthesis tyrosine autokinase [Pseudomonadota bacterium]
MGNEASSSSALERESRELRQFEATLPDVYQEYPSHSAPIIDANSLRGLFNRQFVPMLIALISALIIGGIITALQTPQYEASATVRIEPNGNRSITGIGMSRDINTSQFDEYIRTLGEVARSRSMAETVAENLDLASRVNFVGESIEERRPEGISDGDWVEAKGAIIATELMENLEVEVPLNDSIMTLTYTSTSPALAAEIVNGYAQAFSESDTREEVEDSAYARSFLEEQINETRDQLREAEMASNSYARGASLIAAGSVDTATGGVVTVTGSNLASINATVAEARAARIKAEQAWRAAQNLPAEDLPEVRRNRTVQTLTTERVKLENDLIALLNRYDEQFPEVVETRQRIAQINTQIDKIGESERATLRNNFVIAQNQERALQSELRSVTSSALDEQDRQVQFDVLERDAQALRTKLDSLLENYSKLSSTTDVDRGAISLLDSALVPNSPASPSIPRNMLLALVAGLGLAGGIAFVREFLDDRIRSLETVEERVGLALIGHTPKVEGKGVEGDSANPFSQLIEAYASIKTTIEYSIPRGQNAIQITSSKAGEGKSTTALILAELFARLGRRTLLIDADLRRPSIGALIDERASEMGLVEVLLDHAQLGDVLTSSVHDNLDILTVGNVPPNPVELLSSPMFAEFVEAQRRDYSMIIIDSPPVVGLADAPLISRHVDATVFVIEANKVNFGQARAAVKRLRSNGANVIGAVVSKFVPEHSGQNYGYGYDYYSYGKD